MLNILEIDLDLHGKAAGNFIYSDNVDKPGPFLTGTFQADRVLFYDFDFENVRGKLEYEENTDTVTLEGLTARYMAGNAKADMVIHYIDKRFKVNGQITGIDFQRMNSEFKGTGDIIFSGAGRFEQDPINLTYRTDDIYFYEDQCFKVEGKGKMTTNFSDHYFLDAEGFYNKQQQFIPGVSPGQPDQRPLRRQIPWRNLGYQLVDPLGGKSRKSRCRR